MNIIKKYWNKLKIYWRTKSAEKKVTQSLWTLTERLALLTPEERSEYERDYQTMMRVAGRVIIKCDENQKPYVVTNIDEYN